MAARKFSINSEPVTSCTSEVLANSAAITNPIAGLPNMYEPSWGPPGKVVSAIAEGAGALLALGGLGWATYRAARK